MALVVTIIVLLILSAVAIGLALGDGGILAGARDGAEQWEQGAKNEQDELKQIADFINKNKNAINDDSGGNGGNGGNSGNDENGDDGGNDEAPEKDITKVSEAVGKEKFENTKTIEDDKQKKVTIPKGFRVHEESSTVIDEGIVITDGTNEFVWVPVDNPQTMFIEGTAQLTNVNTTTNIFSNIRVRDRQRGEYETGIPGNNAVLREPDVLWGFDIDPENYKKILNFNSTEEMANSMVEEYKAMSDSIKEYYGFYIGRYELTGTLDNPTEKEGEVLIEGNWYNLYKACKDVIKNNSDVKSTMIYGCQWDETCNWLEKSGYNTSEDKCNWGNYSGSPINTGSDQNYKANNIFDMSGNYWEWTQEADLIYSRTIRGSDYTDTFAKCPASHRGSNATSANIQHGVATRAILYIK